MEWLKPLLGTRVGFDTAPLIYFIEQHPRYMPLVGPFFQAVERGEIQAVTSVLTLTEVMIHPLRHGNWSLADQYSKILINARNLTTLPVSTAIAETAARIRANRGVRTPDAIQLATAVEAQATSFLANDAGLSSLPGLQVLQLDQLLAHP